MKSASQLQSFWNRLPSEIDKGSTTLFWGGIRRVSDSVCCQVRRTCIDEVKTIFDFLAIPAKQVSESGNHHKIPQ